VYEKNIFQQLLTSSVIVINMEPPTRTHPPGHTNTHTETHTHKHTQTQRQKQRQTRRTQQFNLVVTKEH